MSNATSQITVYYFLQRSPGLPLLVDKVALCRAFREHRCHDITRLNIFKDAHNCSLYTASDRLLNEHKALVERQRPEETEVLSQCHFTHHTNNIYR